MIMVYYSLGAQLSWGLKQQSMNIKMKLDLLGTDKCRYENIFNVHGGLFFFNLPVI